MIDLDRSTFLNKEQYLYFLYNNLGCSGLKVCYNFKKEDGDIGWSRHILFEQLMDLRPGDLVPGSYLTRRQFIDKASHRSILDIELVIDIDDKGKFKNTLNKAKSVAKKLNKKGIVYHAYATGSKGYHFHMLFPQLRDLSLTKRTEFKRRTIRKYGGDELKAGNGVMIAIEGEKHWKSGLVKKEVRF
jgi:hypothetical protein